MVCVIEACQLPMFEIRVESSGFIDPHAILISPTHFKSENPPKIATHISPRKKYLPTLINGLMAAGRVVKAES